jgi:multiple sugar transport system ATP-binding protein
VSVATLGLRDLSKVYATGERAVADVDLSIREGELFVVVGPSGSGKSTLLRMIAGLEEPTSGDVEIAGTVVTALPPRQRDVAMAFQGGALYPHMTVFDNIGFPLKVAGVEHHEIERRVRAVARLLHVDDTLDRRPSRLSGGQRQRVAMGRAIIRHPAVFLMDEPLSHLDSKLRVEMRSAIVSLQRGLGVTTVYVTHDQVEAMAMADRVAVMRDGVVVQCGPPLELFEHPADLFVATFLGSPPMAAVRGVIAERNGVAGLRIGSQFLRWPGLRDDHPQLCERDAVAVGIRPHGVSIDPDGCLEASIGAVEDVGHEIVVHAVMVADGVRPVRGGTAVSEDAVATLSVTAHQDVEVDAFRPVRLAVDTMSVHLFDLATGAALERAAATASADR